MPATGRTYGEDGLSFASDAMSDSRIAGTLPKYYVADSGNVRMQLKRRHL
jgi:hypothetical protein